MSQSRAHSIWSDDIVEMSVSPVAYSRPQIKYFGNTLSPFASAAWGGDCIVSRWLSAISSVLLVFSTSVQCRGRFFVQKI